MMAVVRKFIYANKLGSKQKSNLPQNVNVDESKNIQPK